MAFVEAHGNDYSLRFSVRYSVTVFTRIVLPSRRPQSPEKRGNAQDLPPLSSRAQGNAAQRLTWPSQLSHEA
jgi:hypothetical protein